MTLGRPKFREHEKKMTILMSKATFDTLKVTHKNTSNETWGEFLRLRLTKADYLNKSVTLAVDREKTVPVRMSAFDYHCLRFKWSQFCCMNNIYRDNTAYTENGFRVGLLLRGEK